MASKYALRSWTLYMVVPELLVVVTVAGCGADLKHRIVGPIGNQHCLVGPLRIEVTPVNADELDNDHPFCWRGSKTAGFLLFDVKITNTDDKRDLLCLVGHLDFPGRVAPKLSAGHFLEGAVSAMKSMGQSGLIGTDDLRLTAIAHEKATILMEDGYRYQVLNYLDFSERYSYLMQKKMQRAQGLGYIPYFGGFIASAKIRGAAQQRPKRLMQAQQMVMRPGVVPAGRMVRGYLVFGWPPNIQPGSLTLRLPVQPGSASSFGFDVVPLERTPD